MDELLINYTHAMFFLDEASALRAADLLTTEMQAVATRVRPGDDGHFSLYAERENVPVKNLIRDHDRAQEIVERCGGTYDGGFTTLDFTDPARPYWPARPPSFE